MHKRDTTLSTDQKALAINLDKYKYGSIVEIGAGQEVARRFFSVGAAAGTIAKTMSAYDMAVSDDIYGHADRYVSRSRLLQMLDKEFSKVVSRLVDVRPKNTTFFAYAATVTARSFKQKNECHGWVGIRLQLHPGAEPSDVILHVRMLDNDNAQQSEALGILGVNLIHGAFHHFHHPVHIAKVQVGANALAVEVHRQRHQADVARPLAVTKQTALDAVSPGHDGQLRAGDAGAAVVMRMHADADIAAAAEVAAEILDLIGVDVRRRHLVLVAGGCGALFLCPRGGGGGRLAKRHRPVAGADGAGPDGGGPFCARGRGRGASALLRRHHPGQATPVGVVGGLPQRRLDAPQAVEVPGRRPACHRYGPSGPGWWKAEPQQAQPDLFPKVLYDLPAEFPGYR